MSLRSRPILLKSKLKGNVDFVLHNKAEFKHFLMLGHFTKAHLVALCNSVYCPQGHLNAVYSNVARKIQRHIIINTDDPITWASKINATFFPIIEKLAHMYLLVQFLSIPRFCL